MHPENKWFVQDFGAFIEASGCFQVPVVMGQTRTATSSVSRSVTSSWSLTSFLRRNTITKNSTCVLSHPFWWRSRTRAIRVVSRSTYSTWLDPRPNRTASMSMAFAQEEGNCHIAMFIRHFCCVHAYRAPFEQVLTYSSKQGLPPVARVIRELLSELMQLLRQTIRFLRLHAKFCTVLASLIHTLRLAYSWFRDYSNPNPVARILWICIHQMKLSKYSAVATI